MSDGRQVRLLLFLQRRGRCTAAALADELGVSVRTVYRDLQALSRSGVPVVTEAGPGGGVALQGGWSARLGGMTSDEILALAAAAAPSALSALGLSAAFDRALGKVSASLPPAQQAAARHAGERLLVDPSSWFDEAEPVAHLGVLREGVWQQRHVRLTYADLDGVVTTRQVAPLGLVVKAERWYLVAEGRGEVRTFRGSRVRRAALLATSFDRPHGFSLRSFWRAHSERFRERRASFPVTLRLTPDGAAALAAARPASERARLTGGCEVVTIDFERATIAESQLVALDGVEVLDPPALRDRLRAVGRSLRARYGE